MAAVQQLFQKSLECCFRGIAAAALITWNSICGHFNGVTLLVYHLTLKVADQLFSWYKSTYFSAIVELRQFYLQSISQGRWPYMKGKV